MIYIISTLALAAFLLMIVTMILLKTNNKWRKNPVIRTLSGLFGAIFICGTIYCVFNRDNFYRQVESKTVTINDMNVDDIEKQLQEGNTQININGETYQITDIVYDTSNPDIYIEHQKYEAPIAGEKQQNTLHIGVELD